MISRFRRLPRAAQITIGAIAAFILIGIIASGSNGSKPAAGSSTAAKPAANSRTAPYTNAQACGDWNDAFSGATTRTDKIQSIAWKASGQHRHAQLRQRRSVEQYPDPGSRRCRQVRLLSPWSCHQQLLDRSVMISKFEKSRQS